MFEIVNAKKEDIKDILRFIKELAEYEKMSDLVVADEDILCEEIFVKNRAEVLLAKEDDISIGFALFFHNFSTFVGKAGMYLEDLYITPEKRSKGYGKEIFKRLAAIAIERGCGRLEWSCLDWNRPSIQFYLSLGACQMKDWTVYRLSGEALSDLAKNN